MTSIETINLISGQQTRHPLISVVPDGADAAGCASDKWRDLYSLTISTRNGHTDLRLSAPGDREETPLAEGVYFHPDLLCDTPLEECIRKYPCKCRCRANLSLAETRFIEESLSGIRHELDHPIDRHSAPILSSRLELLLNYCVKICD